MRPPIALLLLALGALACGTVACGQVAEEPPPEEDPPAPGGDCSEEGATAPAGDGCNTCTCNAQSWSCTLLLCPPDDTCTEHDTKPADDGCNTCTCADGAWICTAKACIEPACNNGETMRSGCNSCTCTEGAWTCSNLDCPPPCEEGSIKAAGDGCNTCACSDGGWACTDQACPAPECPIPEDLPDQACEGSELYGRAAGTDACCTLCYSLSDYTYYESLEACEASKSCIPSATKYADDQCNTCTCSADQTWACTASDCAPVYCGGLGGMACAEDEYCAYEANKGGCGIGDANAICRKRPTECTEEAAPVCGCDGQTYSNACLAHQAGTGIMTDQACGAGG